MTVPSALRHRLDRDQPALDHLEKAVWDTVSKYSRDCGFAVSARRKTLNSLSEKIETGRFSRWSELDDLYACKIIVPTLNEEPPTLEFLGTAFEEVKVTRRGTAEKPPDVFRFDSTRFWGRLASTGEPEREAARETIFEVQVVTAFEHAWATTTHALAYKTGELTWATQRIAAQMQAAVEYLDILAVTAKTTAEAMPNILWKPLLEQIKVLDGFRNLIASGRLPGELEPDKWSRFCANVLLVANRIRKSDDRRDHHTPAFTVERLLEICASKCEGFTLETFPRSISLMQFVVGCLTEADVLNHPVSGYVPLVTDDLLQVFPSLEAAQGFDLET